MNFIQARVTSVSPGNATIVAAGLPGSFDLDLMGVSANDGITLGIRPEGFGEPGGKGWTVNATVTVVESLGRETLMYVDAGALRAFDSESHEGYFAVQRPSQVSAAYGDPITFTIDPTALFVFAEDGRSLRHPPVQRANQ
jgi:multiple sugar transport system ATP-binding protein